MTAKLMHHTPGPWRFSTEPQPNGCPIVGAKGLMVCMLAHTVNQPDQRDEALANAALIAAAPEMLAALQSVVRQLEPLLEKQGFAYAGAIQSARSAIRKATGAA